MPDSKLERMKQAIAAKKLEKATQTPKTMPSRSVKTTGKENSTPKEKTPAKAKKEPGKPTPPNPDKIMGPKTAGPRARDKLMRKKGRLPDGARYTKMYKAIDENNGTWTCELVIRVGEPKPDKLFGGTTYEYKTFTNTAIGSFQAESEVHKMWVKWQKEQDKPKEDPPTLVDEVTTGPSPASPTPPASV